MFLVKKNISESEMKMNVSFEKVADDLVLVTINNQVECQGFPSYWRLKNTKGIPPLEIGIDFHNGIISYITFFVDVLNVSIISEHNLVSQNGNIIAETNIFAKENEFYDVDMPYDISVCNDKLNCSFGHVEDNFIAYRNGRVEIWVDCNNYIVGFSICDLSKNEIDMIRSINRNINT